MAFLNTTKAKEILKKSGFKDSDISKMQKGEANEVKISEEQLRNIINGDNNILEGLNAAGELLKGSALTRITGHKTTDFSQVQSASAANFATYCYGQLPETTITDDLMLELEKSNNRKIADEINTRTSRIWHDLDKTLRKIKCKKELQETINKELEKPATERTQDFQDAIKEMREEYGLDTNKVVLPESIDKLKGDRLAGIKEYKEKAKKLILGDIELIDKFNPSEVGNILPIKKSVPLGRLGTGAIMLLGCFMGMFILRIGGTGIMERKLKRELIQLKDELTKVVRQINSLSKYITDNVPKNKGTQAPEVNKVEECKKSMKTFLEKQEKLWRSYAWESGREYHERIKGGSETKHWSAGKRVSNEKTTFVGKFKLGLAQQWRNLTVE